MSDITPPLQDSLDSKKRKSKRKSNPSDCKRSSKQKPTHPDVSENPIRKNKPSSKKPSSTLLKKRIRKKTSDAARDDTESNRTIRPKKIKRIEASSDEDLDFLDLLPKSIKPEQPQNPKPKKAPRSKRSKKHTHTKRTPRKNRSSSNKQISQTPSSPSHTNLRNSTTEHQNSVSKQNLDHHSIKCDLNQEKRLLQKHNNDLLALLSKFDEIIYNPSNQPCIAQQQQTVDSSGLKNPVISISNSTDRQMNVQYGSEAFKQTLTELCQSLQFLTNRSKDMLTSYEALEKRILQREKVFFSSLLNSMIVSPRSLFSDEAKRML